jgi:hypothetical protein
MFAVRYRGCVTLATMAVVGLGAVGLADDWNTCAKSSLRDGLSSDLGPDTDSLAWSGGRTSLIAWQPYIEGESVFMVRQNAWPASGPNDAWVVALDIATGEELWAVRVPYQSGDWIPWIGGVLDGQVYVSRSGNGASVWAPLHALSAETGQILWTSTVEISAGAYDGMVFAPNGDPVIGSFNDIWRFDAVDGTLVWHAARTCSVSGTCGAAIHGEAVYVADAVPGGHAIVRYDLDTGAEQYTGELMPGFTLQNMPFCGPDGTIYLSRTQNNPYVDYFYAFADTGSSIMEKWSVPAAWTTTSEFGIGPDGSIYMLMPDFEFVRLDPGDGSVINSGGVFSGFSKPRIAIDGVGRVFLSNGAFDTGHVYAFDADLNLRWDTAVTNINIGGPALGGGGTLIVCGIGDDVRAYRTPRGDMNCDGAVNTFDIDPFVLALTDPAAYEMWYGECVLMYADINADGAVNTFDIDPFVILLTGG